MITQETAARICECYREIEAAELLLKEMSETKPYEIERGQPTLKDAFGRRRHLELGIPSGDSSHRCYRVPPNLALSVLRAHIADKQRELVEANESARIELATSDNSPSCSALAPAQTWEECK
jgi:hypothetical protein